MNIHYLMQHISYSLHTIVRNYGEDQKLQESFCGRPDFTDNRFFGAYPDFTDSRFGGAYLEQRLLFGPSKTMPLLLSVGDKLVYDHGSRSSFYHWPGEVQDSRAFDPLCRTAGY